LGKVALPWNCSDQGDQHQSSRKGEIDGLRAVAIIAVIVNHLNGALLPSGFIGVERFFS